jgi:hypothetical protein
MAKKGQRQGSAPTKMDDLRYFQDRITHLFKEYQKNYISTLNVKEPISPKVMPQGDAKPSETVFIVIP